MNIQKVGQGYRLAGSRVAGQDYLSQEDAIALIRSGTDAMISSAFAVVGADGEVISQLPYEHATADERKLIDGQVVKFGPNAGKSLGELRAVA